MEKLELIYDHYKETFSLLMDKIKQRDRMFVLTFILSIINLLLAVNPDTYGGLFIYIINKKYSIDLMNYFMVIQTFLWIVLIYVTMRYSQAVVYIERTYKYIHIVEKKISKIAHTSFNRESKNYLNNYPIISNIINLIYKYIFSSFAIITSIIKIKTEYKSPNVWYLLIIDTILFITYFVIWVYHIYFVITNDK